jgi:predicted secreted protein
MSAVSSEDIPDDLIELKVANLRAEATLRELAARMPRAVDIAAGTAEVDPADVQSWDEAMATARDTAVEINRHPWIRDASSKAQSHEDLLAAAKDRLNG